MTVDVEFCATAAAGDALTPCRLLLVRAGSATLTLAEALTPIADATVCALDGGDEPAAVLRRHLTPAMAAMGYTPVRHAWEPIACYAPVGKPDVRPGAVALEPLPDLPWGLTHRRADMGTPAYAVIADGAVVSAAWLTGEGIAVETAPAHRRRGYAAAAASALIAACVREGREAVWRARVSNAASCALAASLGMTEIAREWRPVFRKC